MNTAPSAWREQECSLLICCALNRKSSKAAACVLLPAVLLRYGVHAALWCQSHNQGSFFRFHVDVEASEPRQEHHLVWSTVKHLHALMLTLAVQRFGVWAQSAVYPGYMCLALTPSAPGSQGSAFGVTKGSRPPLNTWLRSHNKVDL